MRRVALAVRLGVVGVAGVVAVCLSGCMAQHAQGGDHSPAAQRSHAAAPKGVVTGIAAACTGPAGVTSSRSVTVLAIGSRGFMARQTIVSGTTYRMRLPAGHYQVGLAPSATVTQRVLVRAGQTTVANFPNMCD
jgi:hypothetical protein